MYFPSLVAIATALGAASASFSVAFADDLLVAPQIDGSLVVREGEKALVSFSPHTGVKERGLPRAQKTLVAGHTLIDVRLPIVGDGPKREEVWLAELAAPQPKVIWWDLAGSRDVDGETTLEIGVTERGVEQVQRAARLSRCDGAPVQLFRRTWDFASHAFHPAAPALPAPSGTHVTAHRGDPKMPEGRPTGGFFFSAASSSPGAVDNVSQLLPPAAVNDGNPATIWATEGGGMGQLLTARSSGGFSITGLRLLPGDTRSEKSYRESARPRRITLVFGRDPAQNIDIDLAEDADGGMHRFRQPFYIPLAKPVASSCVTVIVREATSEKVPTAIADMDVLTELDGPQAVERLIADLSAGVACVSRQALLARVQPLALDKVTSELTRAAPGAGRECLLEALDAMVAAGASPTPDTALALISAFNRATPNEEKIIFKLLPGLPAPPADALAGILHDEKRPSAERERAARALALLESPATRLQLLSAVGHGSIELRAVVRRLAASLKGPIAQAALAALEATPSEDEKRRGDLLLILGALAANEPDVRPAIANALRSALRADAPFEIRARAIAGLGLLRDASAISPLIELRETDPDGVLRSLAIAELASAQGPAVNSALQAGLTDADPRVRETAALALGRKDAKASAAQLIAGAKQEPWPGVRRAEVVALGGLCVADGDGLLLRALQRDVDDVRQAALIGLVHCHGARTTPILLRILGRLPESADMRSLAARQLAEIKDSRSGPALVSAMERLLVESQADVSLEGVIADSAMALASIHSQEAILALVALLSDARPTIQRTAVDALGMVCDPKAGAAALRLAAQSKDTSVSIPAVAAEARCRR